MNHAVSNTHQFIGLQDLETAIVNDAEHPLAAEFSIKAINTAKDVAWALLNDVGQLRYKVWSHQGLDMSNAKCSDSLLDSADESAIIWGIYHQGVMVATARLNVYDDINDSPTAYMHSDVDTKCRGPVAALTRLAVHPDYQGQGLGKYLDSIRLKQAREIKAKSIFLMCPPRRVEMLERVGYQCLGKAAPSKLWPDADWMMMTRHLD